jgi:hypothetical protein
MAQLRMTIDPSFTHRVVEILNEKLWDGDIDGINGFMNEGFGLTNRKLNAGILSGKYVMVFNEDGSGNIKPREELTGEEINAMGGAPELMTVNKIRENIRIRICGGTGLLERQKYVILNFRDLFDFNKVHTIDFDSSVLRSDVINLLDDNTADMLISTSLTTKEIICIYNAVKRHETSNNVIESIKNANGHAARLIYIMDQTDNLFHIQANIIKAMDYIKEFIFEDVRNIDMYKENGMKATFDEQMENPGKYFWMQDFFSRCNEINEYYQYIITDPDHQELISKTVLANESITHAAVHSLADFDQDTRGIKRQNTGNPLLDAYLESVNAEHPAGPVKPDGDRWDAGWISPEGAFWADKGTKANFIHLNLAEEIQKYYADSFDWMVKTENIDRELEKHGWLKFHGSEVSFTGYLNWNSGKQQRITNRQIDKLHDYAKHMGFTSLTASFTNKRIVVSEMYDYSQEEWQAIFEC